MSKTRTRPSTKRSTRKKKKAGFVDVLKDNALSIVTIGVFLLCWIGQSITGSLTYNDELKAHGQPQMSYVEYLRSPHFYEATFENWESEFLQIAAMVILTIFLRQKGSPESKAQSSRGAGANTEQHHGFLSKRTFHGPFYDNSLSIALVALFVFCFSGHAISSNFEHNQDHMEHHEPKESLVQTLSSSQFWFESLQNWQSEFLAVGALTILSIFLRQKGSPQSKEPGAPDSETGG